MAPPTSRNANNAAWKKVVPVAVLSALLCKAGVASADVKISSGETQNMNCSNSVCSPTAAKAVLNVSDLQNLLSSGNVTVTTMGSGVQANDIAVDATLTWSNTSTFALDAYRSIKVDATVSVTGSGGVSLVTNDGGADGTLSFDTKGHIALASQSSPLAINGAIYTLENSIESLATAIAGNPSGNYALASSYDASQDGTYSSSPIATVFTGTLEGLGNDISNLSISDSGKDELVGLFAHLGPSGAANDLNLAKVSVIGNGKFDRVGALAAESDGSVSGDSVSGHVKGGWRAYVGGLVGLIGTGGPGIIDKSHSEARVQGGKIAWAGGLVGFQSSTDSTIVDSSASGEVSVADGLNESPGVAGGLLGLGVSVTDCFATGDVTGGRFAFIGGLAGQVSSISNSYATGAVSGGTEFGLPSYIGGLVGYDGAGGTGGGKITASYSTGEVTGGSGNAIGGFAGYVEYGGAADSDYWDSTSSGTEEGVGQGPSGGITGLTTDQLQSGLPNGFKKNIWAENPNINGGLPYLIANPPAK